MALQDECAAVTLGLTNNWPLQKALDGLEGHSDFILANPNEEMSKELLRQHILSIEAAWPPEVETEVTENKKVAK